MKYKSEYRRGFCRKINKSEALVEWRFPIRLPNSITKCLQNWEHCSPTVHCLPLIRITMSHWDIFSFFCPSIFILICVKGLSQCPISWDLCYLPTLHGGGHRGRFWATLPTASLIFICFTQILHTTLPVYHCDCMSELWSEQTKVPTESVEKPSVLTGLSGNFGCPQMSPTHQPSCTTTD